MAELESLAEGCGQFMNMCETHSANLHSGGLGHRSTLRGIQRGRNGHRQHFPGRSIGRLRGWQAVAAVQLAFELTEKQLLLPTGGVEFGKFHRRVRMAGSAISLSTGARTRGR